MIIISDFFSSPVFMKSLGCFQNDERVINAYLGGHYLVEEED